jgi:chromosome segregation ATPase
LVSLAYKLRDSLEQLKIFLFNEKGEMTTMKDRKVYIEKFSNQLKKWDNELEKLETELSNAKDETKSNYQERIDELKQRRSDLKNKLTEMSNASDEAWSTLKTGFEKSWNEFSDAVNGAISQFKS